MAERTHITIDRAEKERFRRMAAREGKSLSEWLRDAARERLVPEDVELARDLAESQPSLTARDLLHLACCRRRGVERVMTFDRALAAAFPS